MAPDKKPISPFYGHLWTNLHRFAFLLTIKDNYFMGKTNCVVIWIRSLNQREPWIAKTAKMLTV